MIRNNSVKVCLLGTRETLSKLVPGLSQLEQYGSSTLPTSSSSKFITTELPIPLQAPQSNSTTNGTTFVLHFKYPKYHDFNWNSLKWSEDLIKMYDHIVCCYNLDKDKILVLGVDGMFSGFVNYAKTKVGNDIVLQKFHFLLASSQSSDEKRVIDELLLSQRELFEFKRSNRVQVISIPKPSEGSSSTDTTTTTTTTATTNIADSSSSTTTIPLPLQLFLLSLPLPSRKFNQGKGSGQQKMREQTRTLPSTSTSAAPIAEEITELFEEPEEQVGPTHFTRFELLQAFKKSVRFIILAILLAALAQMMRPQISWLFSSAPVTTRIANIKQWWNNKWAGMTFPRSGVDSTTITYKKIPSFSVQGNARDVQWSRRNTTYNHHNGVLGLSSTITQNSGISVHAKMLDSDLLTVSFWIEVIDSKKKQGDDLINFCNLNLHDRNVKLSIKNKPSDSLSRGNLFRKTQPASNSNSYTIAMQLGTNEMEHYMDTEFNYNQWYLLTLVNSPQRSTLSMNFHHLTLPVTSKTSSTASTQKDGSKLYPLHLDMFAHDYPLQFQMRNLSIWDRETFDVPSLLKRYIPLEDRIVSDWSRTIFNAGQLSRELFELKNLIELEEDKVAKAQKSYDILYDDYHRLLQVSDTKSAELLKSHLLSRKEEMLQSYRDTLKKFENRRAEVVNEFETQFGIKGINTFQFESDIAATKSAISNTREMQDEFIETRFKNTFPTVKGQAPIVQNFVKNL